MRRSASDQAAAGLLPGVLWPLPVATRSILAVAHLRLVPTSSASISATERRSSSGLSQVRCRSQPSTTTRSPLGASVVHERGPCMLRFHCSDIVLNDEGGPTDDKPDVQAQALSESKTLGSDDHLGDPRQRGPRAVALGGKVRPAGGLAAGADRLELSSGSFPAGRRLLSSKGGRA